MSAVGTSRTTGWGVPQQLAKVFLTRPYAAYHPQHCPCPTSYQGHLIPTPVGSATWGCPSVIAVIFLILKGGGIYCSLKKVRNILDCL